jgi:hypothetical protein
VKSDRSQSLPEQPRSRREYGEALDRLVGRAGEALDIGSDEVAALLDDLVRSAPAEWHGGADRAIAADVLDRLGRYEDAVAGYRDALARWGATSRISTVQRLANVLAKAAVAAVRSGDSNARSRPSDCSRRRNTSSPRSTSSSVRRPSDSRLLGSTRRRQAIVLTDARKRHEAMARSALAYRSAFEQHIAEENTPDYYTGFNFVIMMQLAAGLDAEPSELAAPQELERVIEDCLTAARSIRPPSFHTPAAEADAVLARALVTNTLDPSMAEGLTSAYRASFDARSSPAERLRIREHLDVVRALLPDPQEPAAAALRTVTDLLADDRSG